VPADDANKEQPSSRKPQGPRYSRKNRPISGIVAFINAYRKEQEANRKQEGREHIGRRWREWTTLIFVILTTFGIFYQASILNSSDRAIHASVDAAVRASTINRAWLFVTYDTPQAPLVTGNSVSIHFTIINSGQTPAIITGLDTHLYISTTDMFFSPFSPPEIGSETATRSQEKYRMPAISEHGDFIFSNDIIAETPIAAGGSISKITQSFIFSRELPKNAGHGAWFYCKITYKDVFGITRHTQYYVGLYGATAESGNADYNKWD
jgi:hypothetical protein